MLDPRAEVDRIMQILKPSLELAGKDLADYYIALHRGEEWAIGLKARVEEKLRNS